MILYLLTISCQQKTKYVSKYDIDQVISWIKLNEPTVHIISFAYERTGHYAQLHFHATLRVKSSFRWKPFIQYGDTDFMHLTFRVQWKRVGTYGYQGAYMYVTKDTHEDPILQDQIFNENMFKYHYFNMDTQSYISL